MLDYLFQWVSLRWRDCGWGFSRWDVTPALRREKKRLHFTCWITCFSECRWGGNLPLAEISADGMQCQCLRKNTHEGWTLHVGLLVSVSIAEVERLWLRFQQMGCNASAWEKTHTKVALYMLDYLFQWVLLRWRDCGWGFSRWDVTPALRREKKRLHFTCWITCFSEYCWGGETVAEVSADGMQCGWCAYLRCHQHTSSLFRCLHKKRMLLLISNWTVGIFAD